MKHPLCFILLMTGLLGLTGCPQQIEQPREPMTCSGKATVEQAVQTLTLQRQNVRPFRAGADCLVYFPDEKGRLKPESVDAVTICFFPPDKVYFKGDKAFQEICFGTNEDEFWLRVKPSEDTYWYGSKDLAARCTANLLVNPNNVVEAFGFVDVTADWRLTYRDGYDILDKLEDGKIKKRIYVQTCSYLVSRIEYFDASGALRVSAELSEYTSGENGIVVPSKIYIANYDQWSLETTSIEIKLKHVVPLTLTPEKQKNMFARPDRNGYKNMLELKENCEFEPVKE